MNRLRHPHAVKHKNFSHETLHIVDVAEHQRSNTLSHHHTGQH